MLPFRTKAQQCRERVAVGFYIRCTVGPTGRAIGAGSSSIQQSLERLGEIVVKIMGGHFGRVCLEHGNRWLEINELFCC